ncbi:hypothetical protein B0I68_004076 [Clostridium beijerinckii]|jgi:UDP-N-acetylglucosamine--N-acetylmuramyl-(pentapeptide) pyrophosphoryl-undecaprenol N-acetylglucosamine transferase|nr:hypothetical protein [Clostridium beijerinckii]
MLQEEEIKNNVLYEKVLELKKRKDELINNMEKSQAKSGVEAIINVLLRSVKVKK